MKKKCAQNSAIIQLPNFKVFNNMYLHYLSKLTLQGIIVKVILGLLRWAAHYPWRKFLSGYGTHGTDSMFVLTYKTLAWILDRDLQNTCFLIFSMLLFCIRKIIIK